MECLSAPQEGAHREKGRQVTFEPTVTDRFLIITSPEVETRHDQALLEQDWTGDADWVSECSYSSNSSLSYSELF